jgi:hypothetical protein
MVEGKGRKEGEGPNLWPTDHAWPLLNPYFHPRLHLAPFMLAPLTKASKVKQIPFILFQSSIYLFYFLKILILYDAMMK